MRKEWESRLARLTKACADYVLRGVLIPQSIRQEFGEQAVHAEVASLKKLATVQAGIGIESINAQKQLKEKLAFSREKSLPPQRQQLVTYCEDYFASNGRYPTREEAAGFLGVAPSRISELLRQLRGRKVFIALASHSARKEIIKSKGRVPRELLPVAQRDLLLRYEQHVRIYYRAPSARELSAILEVSQNACRSAACRLNNNGYNIVLRKIQA